MVSVTVEVVSVWLVMEPWVKLGTTGTAITGVPSDMIVRLANTTFFIIYIPNLW